MPIKPPRKGESQSDFMARCMHELGQSDTNRPQEQMVAICMDTWRTAHGGKKPSSKMVGKQGDAPDPEAGESHDDYMQRCMDELGLDDDGEAEDICQLAWDEYSEDAGEQESGMAVVHKTSVKGKAADGMEFILSDATPDRFGDVVEPAGFSTDNFKKNPVALFNHNSDFPIGRWNNVRSERGALRGDLHCAPAGTSQRIDEIRRLIDAGILKAVSVGFRPIEKSPIEATKGTRYVRSELVECSLVSIPANPNALAVAKSLNISTETQRMVFGEYADVKTRSISASASRSGKHADKRMTRSATGEYARTFKFKETIMVLGERIGEAQKELIALCDDLEAHLTKTDNSNVSDADIEATTELNSKITSKRKHLAALQDAEKSLADQTNSDEQHQHRQLALVKPGQRPNGKGNADIGKPAIVHGTKELDPLDYLVRAGRTLLAAKTAGKTPNDVVTQIYGEDEPTRLFTELVFRAASAPAMTTVTGWAAELVQQTYAALMPLLMPQAIFTRLSAKGLALSFGTFGRIIIPTRSRTPTIAGSFVGEGAAIPVRQGAFTTQTLTPKKLAVITTWTREMSEHSTPAIEGVLREAIQQDTSVAIDTVLLDANAATVIRPPGLLNGVAATTATAGGGIAAFIGDITALLGALTTSTYGNLRSPAFLVNPTDMLRASLLQAANTGIFPFQAQIAAGNIVGVPLIDSSTVPTKTMILIDAADFVSVGAEGPRLEISDQATLHFEDTSPADLVSGSPGVVATPQKSLWQTDSLALRMVMPLNWTVRRTGVVAWVQNVSW
jgi:HK97 family phage prohead protease/HK97 family phage major capsid protein